jgi:hypothetical protein
MPRKGPNVVRQSGRTDRASVRSQIRQFETRDSRHLDPGPRQELVSQPFKQERTTSTCMFCLSPRCQCGCVGVCVCVCVCASQHACSATIHISVSTQESICTVCTKTHIHSYLCTYCVRTFILCYVIVNSYCPLADGAHTRQHRDQPCNQPLCTCVAVCSLLAVSTACTQYACAGCCLHRLLAVMASMACTAGYTCCKYIRTYLCR